MKSELDRKTIHLLSKRSRNLNLKTNYTEIEIEINLVPKSIDFLSTT